MGNLTANSIKDSVQEVIGVYQVWQVVWRKALVLPRVYLIYTPMLLCVVRIVFVFIRQGHLHLRRQGMAMHQLAAACFGHRHGGYACVGQQWS